MKKLSFLFAALLCAVTAFSETYSWLCTSGTFSTKGSELNGVTWVASTNGTSQGTGVKGEKCVQIAKNTTLTLTTSHFAKYNIKSVTIQTWSTVERTCTITCGNFTANTKIPTSYSSDGATISFENIGTQNSELKLEWTSSNNALNVRQIIIEYSAGSTDPIAVESVALDATAEVAATCTITLTPTFTPANATNKNVTWTTDNATVATVKDGVVTGVAEGEANITVATEDGNKTATCKVTVTPAPIPFTLVTDAADLAVGQQIIITNAAGSKAMGADKGDNRQAVDATLKEKAIVPTDEMETITLTKSDDRWVLNVAGGSLYAASSSKNHLKTRATNNDANGLWSIAISNNEATITAQGDNTHNLMRYNSNSSLFSCYESGQGAIAIYKNPQQITYTISAAANSETMGTITGAGKYVEKTEATLTATANTGYEFVNWTDAEGTAVSTNAEYTFTVTAAVTYTANFAAKTFDVSTDVNDNTMGSVEGTPTDKVAYGTEITLTAKPNTGFEFVNWKDMADKVVSTDAAYTFTVTEDVALIANFQAKAVPTVVELFTYTTDQSWGESTFEGAKFRDVAVHNGVAYALKNSEARIVALDAKTGAYIQDLDMTDVSGGAITLSAIQTLADGTLLAINCQTNCATGDVKVYKWADKDATPEVLFAGKLDEALRIDAFYYEGTLENGAIWTSYSGGEKGSTCKAIKIPVVSGVAGDFESYVLTSYALETSSRVISASDSEIAIATKGKMYTWTINADKTTTIKYYTEIGNKRYSNNVKLFEFGGSKYMATVYWGDTSGTISSPQIIVSTYTALGRWSTSGLAEVFKSPAEGLGTGRNISFFNGLDVVVGTKGFYVYMTSINGGITACYYGEAETPTEIEDITPSEVVAPKAVKVFRNGQVLILVGDKTYNLMGQVVE